MNHLITDRNSGFKKCDGTVYQLIKIVNGIYEGIDDRKDVCAVYLDISKAFVLVVISPFWSNENILLESIKPSSPSIPL